MENANGIEKQNEKNDDNKNNLTWQKEGKIQINLSNSKQSSHSKCDLLS